VKLTAATLRVTAAERHSAINRIAAEDRRALELAADRIADFHRRTIEKSFIYRDKAGMRLGQLVQPMRRVGIYVPGGLGAYPSSVLMNAIPARVAGVAEIVMVSPPSAEGERLAVLAAAEIAGVDEFYRVGGAQAVAALAYGTETIKPVDKIVGPGNAFVQAAKRMVYGVTDIDKMAGPSEVLVIADDRAHPGWIAADLIAQAEHGSGDEAAVLLTTSASIADRVAEAVEVALKSLPRARQVETALAKRGAMVVVGDLKEAFDLANEIAPEHLELDLRNPSRWIPKIKAAGAVFLGPLTPAPLGDYLAGPNHVLPTGGAARFASPLGAYDYIKRTSIIEASKGAIAALGPAVAHLARMEGFEGHARAMELRAGVTSAPATRKKMRASRG
jgi:histidinol dehydrogenase